MKNQSDSAGEQDSAKDRQNLEPTKEKTVPKAHPGTQKGKEELKEEEFHESKNQTGINYDCCLRQANTQESSPMCPRSPEQLHFNNIDACQALPLYNGLQANQPDNIQQTKVNDLSKEDFKLKYKRFFDLDQETLLLKKCKSYQPKQQSLMPERYIQDLQARELTEEDINRIETGDNEFGADQRQQNRYHEVQTQPLSHDEIFNMRKYKLKTSDISDEKLKEGDKKRNLKAADKIQQKEEKTVAKQESITGLPYIDDILNGGYHVAPWDLKSQLDKCGYECSMCIQIFKPGEEIKMLPKCRHVFHSKCIDPWLKIKGSCPYDRKPVLLTKRPTTSFNTNEDDFHIKTAFTFPNGRISSGSPFDL